MLPDQIRHISEKSGTAPVAPPLCGRTGPVDPAFNLHFCIYEIDLGHQSLLFHDSDHAVHIFRTDLVRRRLNHDTDHWFSAALT